jgi:hypothetical protein
MTWTASRYFNDVQPWIEQLLMTAAIWIVVLH